MQIAKAVDEETVTRDLVPAFVKLLKDTEAEVRTAVAGQIPGMNLASVTAYAAHSNDTQDSAVS